MPSLPTNTNKNDSTKIYTRENLGYVDGYAQYVSKSGGHWGAGIQEKKKIEKTGVDADKRDGARLNWLYDKQSNIFIFCRIKNTFRKNNSKPTIFP